MAIIAADATDYIRQKIKWTCDELDMHTMLYPTAEDALKAFESHGQGICEGVVIDITFVGSMDGITAVQKMRELEPTLPVLFITALDVRADPSIQLHIAALGGRWLKKPFYDDQLKAEIEGMVG